MIDWIINEPFNIFYLVVKKTHLVSTHGQIHNSISFSDKRSFFIMN